VGGVGAEWRGGAGARKKGPVTHLFPHVLRESIRRHDLGLALFDLKEEFPEVLGEVLEEFFVVTDGAAIGDGVGRSRGHRRGLWDLGAHLGRSLLGCVTEHNKRSVQRWGACRGRADLLIDRVAPHGSPGFGVFFLCVGCC